ncbi:MAG: hypothetical protein IPL27_23420 [Lewinellaceae bacterium]|nr:hypothetical protein [Lewinellaceae bacterium]
MARCHKAIASAMEVYAAEHFFKQTLPLPKKKYRMCCGVLEPFDDGVLLRGSTDDLDWLARQLSKFSFDFSVREPEDLRIALHHLAKKLAAQ